MSVETAPKYTAEELNETREVISAIHPSVCSARHEHDWKECMTGRALYNGATIEAIRHLKDNPRDASQARLILHDEACMSGCTGESAKEHAQRQSKTVAALRKYLAATHGA